MNIPPKGGAISINQFESWLEQKENENLEFKAARQNFNFDQLVRYCVALGNEGGGCIILGVTDQAPRQVVGTQSFQELENTKANLISLLHFRIHVEELNYEGNYGRGRVLIFSVPSRPIGVPLQFKGAYWMRGGESLLPMTQDMLKSIFSESQPDFSAQICPGVTSVDLDVECVKRFQDLWHRKTGNDNLLKSSPEQILKDAELMFDNDITYAALILFGSRKTLGRFLPQAEVVFEYRSHDSSISFQNREEYRLGFFSFCEELWKRINLRNEIQHFQDGLFVWDIPTFNEEVVREALLNAVSHRDYQLPGSIFVRQFPQKLEIVSPGGLPAGITPENILYQQSPRNRRIAEAFARCGLVERSGQGFDKMISISVKESKRMPDFAGTNNFQVYLTLSGTVQDAQFLGFLEKIAEDTPLIFSVEDFWVMELIQREQIIPAHLSGRLGTLKNTGVIEKIGRGRGAKYILSKRFYEFAQKRGTYTRRRGLETSENKELILKHLKNYGKGTFKEFCELLPSLTQNQIKTLLEQLKKKGLIVFEGVKKKGFWKIR